MGTKSDYVAGTITVTQGSVDFTGTGTLWRTMGFQEGDTVLLKGYQMVIEAGNVGSGLETQLITSNTSGKFTEAWPGESGTFSYRMRYQSNDSRLSAKVSDFLLRTASGNITAIGELEGIENTLIRFTGPGTVELVEQENVGIQDPNGSLGKLADEKFDKEGNFLTLLGSFVTKATSGIEVENSVMAYGPPTAVIHGYKANGTEEAPTAVVSGQGVYGIGSRPYDGSGFTAHSTAAFHFIATEDFTPTNHGTALRILVTPKGTTQENRKQAISFESDGVSLGIRYKIPASGDVNGRAYFQDVNGGNTALGVLGGGSGKNATVNLFYAGDPANAALFQLGVDADAAFISSANTGAGSVRPLAFKVGGVERARIPTDGNLYVNCESVLNAGGATPGVVTIRHKPGAAHALRIDNPDASGGVVLFVTSAGTAGSISVNGTSTSYNTSSDYRFKDDVTDILPEDAWSRILSVLPREYTNKNTGERQRGMVAHEWAIPYPNSVSGKKDAVDKDGNAIYQTISASNPETIADLIAALKDTRERLIALETKLSGK